jgi:hypothetical protein
MNDVGFSSFLVPLAENIIYLPDKSAECKYNRLYLYNAPKSVNHSRDTTNHPKRKLHP